jgi:hypothetical protein
MTVAELIAALKKLPQDLPCVTDEHCCSGERGLVRLTVLDDAYWTVYDEKKKVWKTHSGKCVEF